MDRKSRLALAILALVTTVLAAHHEQWRDEADGWLVARDASPGEILHLAGYAGTPTLWYFIQVPFAKAAPPTRPLQKRDPDALFYLHYSEAGYQLVGQQITTYLMAARHPSGAHR